MGKQWRPRRRRMKAVVLAGCRGGRCVGIRDGERVVVLTFRHSNSEMDPLALQLPEARRLISELVRVLLSYGDDYAFALAHAARDSGVGAVVTAMEDAPTCHTCNCPPENDRRKPVRAPKVRPSRRPGAPTGPIRATEAWTLHRLLKNLKSHADFLRFINADGADASVDSAPPTHRRKKGGRTVGRKKRTP